MGWVRLLLAALLASELLLRLPILPTLGRAQASAAKVGRILHSKRISDHWKQRMLPFHARIIATQSVLFLAMLCTALLPVAMLGLTHPDGVVAWGQVLMRPLNMLVLFAASAAYVAVRLRLRRG